MKPDSTIPERDEWFVWDLETEKPRTRGELGAVPLQHFVGFDPNLSVSSDGKFAILPTWLLSTVVDLTTGQRVPMSQNLQPLGFDSRGGSVLMLSSSGVISKIRVPTPGDIALEYKLSIPTPEGSNGIVFSNAVPPWSWNLSRDGRILAIGRDREKKTVIVDTAVGGEIGFVADKRSRSLPGNQPFVGGRNRHRVIAHDGSFMTSTDMQGEIKLWRLGEVTPAFKFPQLPKGPDGKPQFPKVPKDERERESKQTAAVSPVGRHVATLMLFRKDIRKDNEIRQEYQVQFDIHDRATGELVSTSPRYDARLISRLSFDRDGRRVVGLVLKSIYRNPK